MAYLYLYVAPYPIVFTETVVARHYDTDTALIDISNGVDAVRRGLDAAAEQLGIDLVVGVDAGGDVLARGDEPGVRSPVIDGIGLVALDDLDTDACLGVFGYGSDDKLTHDELEDLFQYVETEGLDDAIAALQELGLQTEFETERNRLDDS